MNKKGKFSLPVASYIMENVSVFSLMTNTLWLVCQMDYSQSNIIAEIKVQKKHTPHQNQHLDLGHIDTLCEEKTKNLST